MSLQLACQQVIVDRLLDARNHPLNVRIRVSLVLLPVNKWPCSRTLASLFEHGAPHLYNLLQMLMYREAVICFIPVRPAPLDAPSGSSQIRRVRHLERTQNAIWIRVVRYSHRYLCSRLGSWRKVRFIRDPWFGSPLFYRQRVHITGILISKAVIFAAPGGSMFAPRAQSLGTLLWARMWKYTLGVRTCFLRSFVRKCNLLRGAAYAEHIIDY